MTKTIKRIMICLPKSYKPCFSVVNDTAGLIKLAGIIAFDKKNLRCTEFERFILMIIYGALFPAIQNDAPFLSEKHFLPFSTS